MSSQLDYEALHDQDNPRQDFERSAAHILRHTIAQEYPNSWWMSISAEKALFQGQSYLFMKRVMDLTLIVLSMPIWLMIIGTCALLVKLDSPGGPVFFKQWRTGKDGNRFQIYKFRTMVPNAEQIKQDLMHLNELQWPDFKITSDPRITRVGRILRKTSLDELPQLLNVIRGEMSIVGPRPTSFKPETYALWQTERLDVLPGVTGLWQVIGRGSMEFDARVRLDIAYIERQCLWLDFLILIHTATAVVSQRGAY